MFLKGTKLHETINLPLYWVQTFKARKNATLSIKKWAYGDHKKQYLLACSPKDKKIKTDKVIVYYHGGGWRTGSPEMFIANAQVFAEKGYTVFMPSYRRAPKFSYPDIREDLNLSLKKIKELKQSLGLENAKIVLGGMSAGGNVSALISFDRKTLNSIGFTQKDFAGIFLCGAPLDLNTMDDTFVLRDYCGERNSRNFKLANPINYIQKKEHLPVIIIHGNKDGFVPFQGVVNFYEKLKAVNPNVRLHEINKGSHLDAGRWTFNKGIIRKILLNWTRNLD